MDSPMTFKQKQKFDQFDWKQVKVNVDVTSRVNYTYKSRRDRLRQLIKEHDHQGIKQQSGSQ